MIAPNTRHSTPGYAVKRDDMDLNFWPERRTSLKPSLHMAEAGSHLPLAESERLGGTVVTSDHKEWVPIVPLGICPIELFIR